MWRSGLWPPLPLGRGRTTHPATCVMHPVHRLAGAAARRCRLMGPRGTLRSWCRQGIPEVRHGPFAISGDSEKPWGDSRWQLFTEQTPKGGLSCQCIAGCPKCSLRLWNQPAALCPIPALPKRQAILDLTPNGQSILLAPVRYPLTDRWKASTLRSS